jgi:hypothetical protein
MKMCGNHQPMPVERSYFYIRETQPVMPRSLPTSALRSTTQNNAEIERVTRTWCPNCNQFQDIPWNKEEE